MKQLSLLASLLVCLSVNSQIINSFDCGLFSFDYPSTFQTSQIQNAPHMVLKLQSKDYLVSASYWDKGFDSETSIWDEYFVEYYKEVPSNETFVKLDKVTLQTKNGKHKCLRLITNIFMSPTGVRFNMRMIKYMLINDGYLFVFAFGSKGEYSKNSPTSYSDNFMRGLKFKSQTPPSKPGLSEIQSYMLQVVKSLNDQCPIQTDKCTVHKQIIMSGKTVIFKTIVEDACEVFVDYDEFMQKMSENFSNVLDKRFVQYLEEYGFSLVYHIYNENNKLKKEVRISCADILKYYSN